MKKHLAHALRRTARRLIAWSNRLDAPTLAIGVVRNSAAGTHRVISMDRWDISQVTSRQTAANRCEFTSRRDSGKRT